MVVSGSTDVVVSGYIIGLERKKYIAFVSLIPFINILNMWEL